MAEKDENAKRTKVARFFGKRINVRAHLAWGIGLSLASAALFFLTEYALFGLLLAVLPVVLVGRVIWSRFNIPDESEVLRILNDDWAAVSQRADRQLRVPRGRQDENLWIVGQIMAGANEPRNDIPSALGKNNREIYAANRVIVFQFSQHVIGVYIADVNSLEPTRNGLLLEWAFECYYTDIVSFEVRTRDPVAEGLLDSFNLRQLNLRAANLGRALDKLTTVLRTETNRKFLVLDFGFVASNGQRIGTSIGVIRSLDSQGIYELDDTDRKIDKIREMIREKKRQGFAGAPVNVRVE